MTLGDPILTCAAAGTLEKGLFGGDEARAWQAMTAAGRAVAAAAAADFLEIGGFPAAGTILVLAGKGNNAGDALIAAQALLERFPGARAEVVFAFGERGLRPLAQRAWRGLAHAGRRRVSAAAAPGPSYDLCLDGIFGFQFRPPLPAPAAGLLEAVNALPVRLRAAVDLPSGLGDAGAPGPAFRADFTYATGSVKQPAVQEENAEWVGRLRYLDLGFFRRGRAEGRSLILGSRLLEPLAGLRSPRSDKRTFGHLLLIGGSRSFPGAILMSALAAARSGAGFVTAAVPESLAPAYAARIPEVIWHGLPETRQGGLSRRGARQLAPLLERATALALGPGLSREKETLSLAAGVVRRAEVPLVIDADGLQPEIVRAGAAPRVLTPHRGEWQRIEHGKGGAKALARAVIVHKGRLTTVAGAGQTLVSPFGGPVLARGGSGDLLTGLIGGLLAQHPFDPLLAAARGVVWHGRAADLLARAHGQAAVQVTQLLEYLPQALREG
ncbi:MAG TPA: NAD(P)H-hydrate dehydratase [Opitutaceae bacterium]|nr:NAD(P)H-hydrate dehydratase [Opitutaceae bacterium]